MTMKAQREQQRVTNRCLARPRNGRRERDLNHEEVQSLLAKLKELVPNMPRNKKLSKLQIIQNVIDYILDLQIALETHPPTHSSHVVGSGTNPTRQPLGNLLPSTNAVINTCSPQKVGRTTEEEVPANLVNLMSAALPSQYPVLHRNCDT
ncbi:DNA-binding protein inhibitor ID-2-like [Haemaphysalis longicornis]